MKTSAPQKLTMTAVPPAVAKIQHQKLEDLISLESLPASKPSGIPQGIDGFTDFVDADPMKSTDNDFSDFQECKT